MEGVALTRDARRVPRFDGHAVVLGPAERCVRVLLRAAVEEEERPGAGEPTMGDLARAALAKEPSGQTILAYLLGDDANVEALHRSAGGDPDERDLARMRAFVWSRREGFARWTLPRRFVEIAVPLSATRYRGLASASRHAAPEPQPLVSSAASPCLTRVARPTERVSQLRRSM